MANTLVALRRHDGRYSRHYGRGARASTDPDGTARSTVNIDAIVVAD